MQVRRAMLMVICLVLWACSYTQAVANQTMTARERARLCRCTPQQSCWPSEKAWKNLQSKLTGRLTKPSLPLATCIENIENPACAKAMANIHNPFFNEGEVGGTQSQGWAGAWHNEASAYAVEAETAQDIATAVKFAHNNKIRVVVKGTGHDYLGRSNAPDSLLIWTHKMRKVEYHDLFTPSGCPKTMYRGAALTVDAGVRWIDAYNEVTTKHHRYIQGGGCTTVGAAGGFTQGGGFGSFSKKYGTGAASLLEAEIVTAKGDIITANACQNEDLFWAVRGGGAGTFGVVTKMTFDTHPLPTSAGLYQATIKAKSDVAYQILLEQFLVFFRQYLNNDHWGEQFSFDKDNTIRVNLIYQGLSQEEVEKTWMPLSNWLAQNEKTYDVESKVLTIPPEKLWDEAFWQKNYPEMIDDNSGANNLAGEYWWAGDTKQAGEYWYTYKSWWLPLTMIQDEQVKSLVKTVFDASRVAPVAFHINKGLAGGSVRAMRHTRATSINPSVLQAAALIIMAAGNDEVYAGVKGLAPDPAVAHARANAIQKAMSMFEQAAPEAGAYANEADYFQKNWQVAFWGDNYSRLAHIKQMYDPDGVFYCHHCVGSERWIENGMCKAQ